MRVLRSSRHSECWSASAVTAHRVDGFRFHAVGGGGPNEVLAAGDVAGIAVDANSIEWTDSAAGTVNSMSRLGGPKRELASAQVQPTGIVVDASYVYGGERGDGRTELAC